MAALSRCKIKITVNKSSEFAINIVAEMKVVYLDIRDFYVVWYNAAVG